MDIELLLDAHAVIAESPTWVAAENAVYWIDVRAPSLHRLDLATRTDRAWALSSDVGAFALVAGRNEALVALRHGLHLIDLDTGAETRVAPPPFDPALFRFNEGACDSSGRFWLGVMFDPVPGVRAEPRQFALQSFTFAGGLRAEPDATELHNGMAWSPDERTFYLSHTKRHAVFAVPFAAGRGMLGAPRLFAELPSELGVPDGAAVDAEGCYWCAVHGASRLHRYRPDGRLNRTIELPVSQPTMCAFAGPALDRLVVTSASQGLTNDQRRQQPHAGGLFCLQPGVQGIPRYSSVDGSGR
jgi:sugar lactone lactonase YvrE